MMQDQNHITGCLRENLVAVDLLRRGFEVYTGSGHSSFDLVAYKDGYCIRIEVKGLRKGSKGPISMIRGSCGNFDCRKFDVLAVVDSSYQILYRRSVFYNAKVTSAWELVKDNENFDKRTTHNNIERARKMDVQEEIA